MSSVVADGVRSTREALDQMAAGGYLPLLQRCVLGLVSHSEERATDLGKAERSLAVHGVHVVRMPYDRHLAAGATIDLGRISESTREFTLQAAAEVLLRSTWS